MPPRGRRQQVAPLCKLLDEQRRRTGNKQPPRTTGAGWRHFGRLRSLPVALSPICCLLCERSSAGRRLGVCVCISRRKLVSLACSRPAGWLAAFAASRAVAQGSCSGRHCSGAEREARPEEGARRARKISAALAQRRKLRALTLTCSAGDDD